MVGWTEMERRHPAPRGAAAPPLAPCASLPPAVSGPMHSPTSAFPHPLRPAPFALPVSPTFPHFPPPALCAPPQPTWDTEGLQIACFLFVEQTEVTLAQAR